MNVFKFYSRFIHVFIHYIIKLELGYAENQINKKLLCAE